MAANTCKKPEWLKQRVCDNKIYNDVRNMMKELKLHTVCENANCPNIGECFGHRTATFLILGGICTRACKYCAVPKGRPEFLDKEEPEKLAAAVVRLGLKHVVITSVTRDDLPDGGAAQFAECIKMVRLYAEKTSIEVLVPDFKGSKKSLDTVLNSQPEVFNHNIEIVERFFSAVRPVGSYHESLRVLQYASDYVTRPLVKSGMMVGFGETSDDMKRTFNDLSGAGVDIITIGQYLRPSDKHVPVAEYVTPDTFEHYKELAAQFGIAHVVSGPLVRSSYKAGIVVENYRKGQASSYMQLF